MSFNFKTATTLLKTADIIETEGWCTGSLHSDDGHCAIGGIVKAVTGENIAEYPRNAKATGRDWADDAIEAVNAFAPFIDPNIEPFMAESKVIDWNDAYDHEKGAKANTQETVVAKFRDAAASLLPKKGDLVQWKETGTVYTVKSPVFDVNDTPSIIITSNVGYDHLVPLAKLEPYVAPPEPKTFFPDGRDRYLAFHWDGYAFVNCSGAFTTEHDARSARSVCPPHDAATHIVKVDNVTGELSWVEGGPEVTA